MAPGGGDGTGGGGEGGGGDVGLSGAEGTGGGGEGLGDPITPGGSRGAGSSPVRMNGSTALPTLPLIENTKLSTRVEDTPLAVMNVNLIKSPSVSP